MLLESVSWLLIMLDLRLNSGRLNKNIYPKTWHLYDSAIYNTVSSKIAIQWMETS
jgi:hypothetical protein